MPKFTHALDLAIYQDRAENGPYKNANDAPNHPNNPANGLKNTPGDFATVAINQNTFAETALNNPTHRYYLPYSGAGPVPVDKTGGLDAKQQGIILRDAAFFDYVKGTDTHTARVITQLLDYANDPRLDWSNRTLFNTTDANIGDGNPLFTWSELIARLLFGWDCVKPAASSGNQTTIDNMFRKFGHYVKESQNRYYYNRFANGNRLTGQISSWAINSQKNDYKQLMYWGSPLVGEWARGWNNRMCTNNMVMGLIGVFLGDQELIDQAKLWVREWIKWGVYPGNDVADGHRNLVSGEEPERGLNYIFGMIFTAGYFAYVLALNGDKSLLDHTSEDGLYGSESPGQPKGFLGMMLNALNYLNGTHQRYALSTDPALLSPTEREKYLLNGIDPFSGTRDTITYYTWFAMLNTYYQDSVIDQNIRRVAAGCYPNPVPARQRMIGSNKPEGGNANLIPGVSFMHLQVPVLDRFSQAKIAQLITFPQPSNKTFGDAPFNLEVSAGSGEAVTLAIISGSASLAGNQLTITGAGTVKVRASQPGNATYAAAPTVERTFTVAKAPAPMTFAAITDKQLGVDAPFSLNASVPAGLPISYEIVSGPGSILAGTYNYGGVGQVTIRASQPGNANYLASSAERSFLVTSAPVPVVSNVLLGKLGTTSAVPVPYTVANLTDGQPKQSPGAVQFRVDWSNAVWGSAKTITKIVIVFNQVVPSFRLQHNPGSGFVDLASASGNQQLRREFVISGVSISNLRYEADGKDWDKVSEIEVYGS
jgi:hypothetical protein